MKKTLQQLVLLASMLLLAVTTYGQIDVSGKVVDASSKESLPGALIQVKGSTLSMLSGFDGSFTLKDVPANAKLVFSFIGYETLEVAAKADMGLVGLNSDAVGIGQVEVLANVAIDRKTPVAVSTIKPELIEEKLGTQEFPEILKSTPGVYATKQGGAFGDSRINLRGFDSRNVGVMINGVPVNDMENGKVYWSNWAGLSDATRSMQVQRGLGASKVAIPSVGGTINILTQTTDAKQGGTLFHGLGNDGYSKSGFTVASGLTENNWATTLSLYHTKGDGYVDGTEFDAWSYFVNLSKQLNDKHRFAFSIFGAPQWHGQRYYTQSIDLYKEMGIRHSEDWGYRNGQVEYVRKNFYHKPQAILNHFWTINPTLSLTSALYASIGTGGGTGPLGSSSYFYGEDSYRNDGVIDFDRIADHNAANAANGLGSDAAIRASYNSHSWYGYLTSARYEISDLVISGGVDLRYYKGEHYQEVSNLLGGAYYLDNSNDNNPNNAAQVGDKVSYYDDGEVLWEGLFGQAEYTTGDLSAFFSTAVSNKSYRRTDYFNYLDSDPEQTTPWVTFLGFSAKGGANYNLTDNHNLFVNAGYFENQPGFDAIFLNYKNDINEQAENEKVMSFELGYGYRSSAFTANLNAYYTQWNDRTFSKTMKDQNNNDELLFANILGVDATHQGVELDFVYMPMKGLNLTGMASIGDWKWANDIQNVQFTNEQQQPVGDPINLYIADVHVGDAAQTTFALGANFDAFNGMKVGIDYNYYDNLFAQFNPNDRTKQVDGVNFDSWKVPAYHLLDLSMSYKFKMGKFDSKIMGKINNLLDTEYISDARDGTTWDTSTVHYGWGRSWSIGLKVKF